MSGELSDLLKVLVDPALYQGRLDDLKETAAKAEAVKAEQKKVQKDRQEAEIAFRDTTSMKSEIDRKYQIISQKEASVRAWEANLQNRDAVLVEKERVVSQNLAQQENQVKHRESLVEQREASVAARERQHELNSMALEDRLKKVKELIG